MLLVVFKRIHSEKDSFFFFFSTTKELNLAVVGSQIVGLVPLKAMLDTAEYYMEKENLFILEEDQKLRLVGCCFLIISLLWSGPSLGSA